MSLQNVGLSVHACRAVGEMLSGAAAQRLRRLQLFNNMSGDEGATHIATLLQSAPKLEVGVRRAAGMPRPSDDERDPRF